VIAQHPLPVSVSGYGSMMALHALSSPPADGDAAPLRDPALQKLIFLGLYRRGIYTAPRGMINLSLPLTDAQLNTALVALDETLTDLGTRPT
jgi:glutamate-1-semialdehyde 2,1-aminomutase